MAVPRSERDFEGLVGVNGFGFVGMLLAREEAGVEAVRRNGPLQVLKAVSFPR
jgi:ATP adenylyltransferase/5',5'''-P-1,P-4-tetraphosphate phosphorylase II